MIAGGAPEPPEVVAVGCIAADIAVAGTPRGVQPGQTGFVRSITPLLGGNPTNMASGLARLGHRVAVVGGIGEDAFGRLIADRLTVCGVDTRLLRMEPGLATSATLAMVHPSGERTLYHFRGSNDWLDEAALAPALGTGAKIFSAGGLELLPAMRGAPAGRIFEGARRAGMMTVLDTTFDPDGEWLPAIGEALPWVDLLLTSMGEAAHYAGSHDPLAVQRFFRRHGARRVVIKDGAQGCYVPSDDSLWQVPPPEVQAIDTTGAGDNFGAGFIAGVLRGFSSLDAARLGVTCGALSTESLGGEAPYRDFGLVWERARKLQASCLGPCAE